MRKLFFVLFFSVILNFTYLYAQTSKGSSIFPLLYEGESRYKELVEKSNKRISRFEIDFVNMSSNKFTPVKLVSDKTYTILLIGELDVINEIGLKIYTKLDRSMTLRKDFNNSARILDTTFKPDRTDFYEFEVIAKKSSSQTQTGRYCLIIAYE